LFLLFIYKEHGWKDISVERRAYLMYDWSKQVDKMTDEWEKRKTFHLDTKALQAQLASDQKGTDS
jgi:hypothetical protein